MITSIPTTATERLSEIMIRQLNLDVQIDCYAFAAFITAFTDIEGFDSMPWEERARILFLKKGVSVNEKTLRNWCSKLIRSNTIANVSGITYWKTEYINGIKIRTQVQREDSKVYYNRRSELIKQLTRECLLLGMSQEEARKEAWKNVYLILWDEMHCCYYCCKTFLFNAFSDNGPLYEVFELAKEITGE